MPSSPPGPKQAPLLHVITSLQIGGAEHMLVKLAEAGLGRQAPLHVVSLTPGGAFRERLVDAGATVTCLGGARGPKASPLPILALARLIRALRPAAVQGWMYHGNLAALLACALARYDGPLCWNIRGALAGSAFKMPTRAVIRAGALLSRRPDAIIFNSAAAVDDHASAGYSVDRAIVIPNGFDCDRLRPDPAAGARLRSVLGIPADRLIIGTAARYHPMKDFPTLLTAAGRMAAVGADIHLVLIGPGVDPANPALAEEIVRQGLQERVSLLGARTDVPDLMPGFDIFALSSAFGEGFPNAVGEAMACGIPCAATDVGDTRAVLGDAGLLVPPRDATALAAALSALAAMDPAARQAMGRRGRDRVTSRYSLAAVCARYRALYAGGLPAVGAGPAPADGIDGRGRWV